MLQEDALWANSKDLKLKRLDGYFLLNKQFLDEVRKNYMKLRKKLGKTNSRLFQVEFHKATEP